MGGLPEEDALPHVEQTVCVTVGDSLTDLVVVRQRVRELLVGYPQDVVADAVQLADALASNAHDHGETPKEVRLILTAGETGLRVEADDASPFALPEVRGWSGTNGLGMVVVSMVAASWGVERHPGHKTVWADMELIG